MKTPFVDCPCCKRIVVLKNKPKPSDLTVCSFCATMLEFDVNNNIAVLSSEKFLSFDSATQQGLNEIVYTIVNKHR